MVSIEIFFNRNFSLKKKITEMVLVKGGIREMEIKAKNQFQWEVRHHTSSLQ